MDDKQKIRVDIDNTICETVGTDYAQAKPNHEHISYINSLYDQGHNIVYWTSRGVGSGQNLYDQTKQQLDTWGCKYHELKCDKPVYDLFIDDKTKSSINQAKNKKLKENRKKIILLDEFYKDKKVCIIGCGDSINNFEIDFLSYDVVVGINRIYLTKYAPYVNIYYNSMSSKEYKNFPYMLEKISGSLNFQHFYCAPWSSGPKTRKFMASLFYFANVENYTYNKRLAREVGRRVLKRPLTGMSALYHVLLSQPEKVDLYGYDFYNEQYIDNKIKRYNGHNRLHDLNSNQELLVSLIQEHGEDKIRWVK